ncbi:hypothetical protein JCM10213v2_006914 [Rhodosporidiobolus nylandii]
MAASTTVDGVRVFPLTSLSHIPAVAALIAALPQNPMEPEELVRVRAEWLADVVGEARVAMELEIEEALEKALEDQDFLANRRGEWHGEDLVLWLSVSFVHGWAAEKLMDIVLEEIRAAGLRSAVQTTGFADLWDTSGTIRRQPDRSLFPVGQLWVTDKKDQGPSLVIEVAVGRPRACVLERVPMWFLHNEKIQHVLLLNVDNATICKPDFCPHVDPVTLDLHLYTRDKTLPSPFYAETYTHTYTYSPTRHSPDPPSFSLPYRSLFRYRSALKAAQQSTPPLFTDRSIFNSLVIKIPGTALADMMRDLAECAILDFTGIRVGKMAETDDETAEEQ